MTMDYGRMDSDLEYSWDFSEQGKLRESSGSSVQHRGKICNRQNIFLFVIETFV